jgi:hypothetical protein
MNLIITFDKNEYFFPYLNNKSCIVVEPLKGQAYLYRILRRIPLFAFFAFDRNILRLADNADKIVVFDSAYTDSLGKYLSRFKNKLFIYWWNPIYKNYGENGMKIINKAKRRCRVCSFDPQDCARYHLEFAPMKYSSSETLPKRNVKYNIFFIGAGNDRFKYFFEIYKYILCHVDRCKYIIVTDQIDKYISDSNIEIRNTRVLYSDYLHYISESQTMLDIPQKGQAGNTIRVVESLFFKKKLITTNRNVRKYDFYNKQNIFIVGEDDPKSINDFIKTPYKNIGYDILKKYDIEYWIKELKV